MSRANLEIAVVKYTGTGAAAHKTDWTTLTPKFALLNASGQQAVIGMAHMQGKVFAPGAAIANLASAITQIGDGGVVLGTSPYANAAATTYYGLVIAARGSEAVYGGRYRGTGVAGNIQSGHFPHTPDIAIAGCSTNATGMGVMRTRANPTSFCPILGASNALGTLITDLLSDGISVGNSATVNGSAHTYDYLSLKAVSGAIAYGSFACTGAQQSITGLGLDPDCVIAKTSSQTTPTTAVMATTDMIADGVSGMYLGTAANPANAITSLDSDGFTVGSSASINEAGKTTFWIAFKAGEFFADLNRAAV